MSGRQPRGYVRCPRCRRMIFTKQQALMGCEGATIIDLEKWLERNPGLADSPLHIQWPPHQSFLSQAQQRKLGILVSFSLRELVKS